jgi:long-chain acyl-CoA synthetase
MDLVAAAAEARPGHLALVHADERLTYGELVERVRRLAGGLAERGIGAGDRVALVLANSPSFVIGFLAVTSLGAAIVPLNPSFKQDELESSFAKCAVGAVISDDLALEVCERIAAAGERPLLVISTRARGGRASLEALVDEHPPLAPESRRADEVFAYQFSSGSTGRPKRLARTHGQLHAEAGYYTWIGPSDRVFCAVPLFHTYGMGCCLIAALCRGATLVLLEEPHPFVLKRQRALELIEAEQATVFPGVPFNFRLLAEAPADADLSCVRWCFSAGTALPRAVFDAFADRFGVPVRQLYGCTEAGTLTANLDPDPVATFASVGTPAGEVTVRIVDERGEPAPAGQAGEVVVTSPAMTEGYSDLAELARQAFRDGSFFTGDVGRLDDDGRLYLQGRKKLFIEVAGNKVDPLEVEDVVVNHPKVREVVVVGVKGEVEGEEVVKAVVVPSDDCRPRELQEFCHARLANFKVPRIVEFREEIPKSPLGKVLRKYLV